MIKLFYSLLFISATLFNSCSNGQSEGPKTNLPPTEFSEKIKEQPSAQIVDVRTPEEFEKGHLPNAKNMNWNGSDFDSQIETLDKSKPVFVYCLSGSRSSAAAQHMRSNGFEEVIELKGGIMGWRRANLPETTENTVESEGMTMHQYNDLLNADKLILVDFYADWCAPCKKMKPYLDEISNEMGDRVEIVRINADDHQELSKELQIEGLPFLKLYKNKTLVWSYMGYVDKAEVVKQIDNAGALQ